MIPKNIRKVWLPRGLVAEKGTCAESASRRHNAQATCAKKHMETRKQTGTNLNDAKNIRKVYLPRGLVVETGTCAESASRRHNAQATCLKKHPRNIRKQNFFQALNIKLLLWIFRRRSRSISSRNSKRWETSRYGCMTSFYDSPTSNH